MAIVWYGSEIFADIYVQQQLWLPEKDRKLNSWAPP
jgi:hypothetical protein